eukprot:IDg3439t1
MSVTNRNANQQPQNAPQSAVGTVLSRSTDAVAQSDFDLPRSSTPARRSLFGAGSCTPVDNVLILQNSVEEDSICPRIAVETSNGRESSALGEQSFRVVYIYIQSLTLELLRAICRCWKLGVSGSKKRLLARVFLSILSKTREGHSLDGILSTNIHMNAYTQYANLFCAAEWEETVTPSENEMLLQLSAGEREKFTSQLQSTRNRNEVGRVGSHIDVDVDVQGPATPIFSLNEFARLFVILGDDEQARAAVMRAACSSLSRLDLEHNATRESFWKIVETRFNNKNVRSLLNLHGRVDEVDSAKLPLVFRRAEKLSSVFRESRSIFHGPLEKWRRSGHNEGAGFPNFLPKLSNGDLTKDSKKCFIIFTVCRLGTDNADTSLVNMVARTIEGDGGYDEGMAYESELRQPQPESSDRSRKRRRSYDASERMADSVTTLCDKFYSMSEERTAALRMLLGNGRTSSGESLIPSSENGKEKEIQEARRQTEMMEHLEKAAKRLKEAEDTGNTRYIEIANRNFKIMDERYNRLFQE